MSLSNIFVDENISQRIVSSISIFLRQDKDLSDINLSDKSSKTGRVHHHFSYQAVHITLLIRLCTSPTLLIPNFLLVSAREIAASTKNLYPLKNKEVGQKLVNPAHQTHREKKRWKVENIQHSFWNLVVQKCMFIIATLNWGPSIETAKLVS